MALQSRPPCKRQLMENGEGEKFIKIGTHNGTFHCDEVLACYMLKQIPKYRDAAIVRSRDSAVLDDCDVVVDVGGIYNPSKNRFDHHQRTFVESMNSLDSKFKWTTKLSSAGLIYFHFGREVLTELIKPLVVDEDTLNTVYLKIYEGFVEEVDAVDNGIDQYVGEPRYHVSTTLGSRVARKNPSWNVKNYDEQELFMEALSMVGEAFSSRVLGLINHWLPARSIVESAVKQRFTVHKSGEIMKLDNFCPWKEHLFDFEEHTTIEPTIKYVIYSDNSGKARVQCVPKRRNTFENRLSLLPEWRGLRDEELSAVSGVSGCIFVHASGFIGGNQDTDGAISMAIKSLQSQNLD